MNESSAARPSLPRPGDILAVQVTTDEVGFRELFRLYSLKHGDVQRRDRQVTFRAFVPQRLLEDVRRLVGGVEIRFNASAELRRMSLGAQVGTGNRFADGSLPPLIGARSR